MASEAHLHALPTVFRFLPDDGVLYILVELAVATASSVPDPPASRAGRRSLDPTLFGAVGVVGTSTSILVPPCFDYLLGEKLQTFPAA